MTNRSTGQQEIIPREGQRGVPTGPSPTGLQKFDYVDAENSTLVGDSETPITVLGAPSNLVVKSQTIRFTPEGVQTVDVVIEFNEIAGASHYEHRVAPI